MDPYLEEPGRWLDVHHRLLVYLCDDLNQALGGRYFAMAGERVVIDHYDQRARAVFPDLSLVRLPEASEQGSVAVAPPPVPVKVRVAATEYREGYLEIRDRTGEKVVTVVELLSPANKMEGADGRNQYLRKQAEVLASDVSLVEMDLLRGGRWTVAVPEPVARQRRRFDYIVSVSRPADRSEFEIYPVRIQDPLPPIRVPLSPGDDDCVADLASLLDRCYDRGQYGRRIDYRKDPEPPLDGPGTAWAAGLLRGARLRT